MKTSRSITRVALLLVAAAGVVACQQEATEKRDAVSPSARASQEASRYSFVDVTRRAAMTGSSRTWGSSWTDFDLDGRPDLLIGRHWADPLLMRGLGGTRFTRVRDGALEADGVDRHVCTWGEADGDGRPDLYCVQGADRGVGQGPNQLLVQTDAGFEDRARKAGVSDPFGRGRTANWLDYDSDGDLDLFVGNLTRAGYPNEMFRNDGGTFARVEVGLSDELATESSSWADWDLDGDPDLLVMQHDTSPVAYENVDATFERIEIPNVTDETWSSAAWGDLDSDGRPDLHLVSYASSRVLRNTGTGFEPVHSGSVQFGRMSVWADVDNDGDLDSFVVQGASGRRPNPGEVNHPELLLINSGGSFETISGPSFRGPRRGNGDAVSAADFDRDGRVDVFTTNGRFLWRGPNSLLKNRSQAQNWVGIDLMGPNENPFGYGATVIVRAGDLTVRRQVTDEANYRTQNEVGYVHVGLGAEDDATIEVRWADGTRDCVPGSHGSVIPARHGVSPCPHMRG